MPFAPHHFRALPPAPTPDPHVRPDFFYVGLHCWHSSQDLLETLQTAVEVELSLTAKAVAAPGYQTSSPPLRKLPHQRSQQSPLAREALSTGGSVGGGSVGDGGGGGGAGAKFDQTATGSQKNGAAAILTPEAAAASAVQAATRREAGRKEGAPPPTGNRSEAAVLTPTLAAVATTAAAAWKRRQGRGGSPGRSGARAVGSSGSGSGSASGGGTGSINASSISGEPSDTPTRRGHFPGKGPPDRTENDTATTATDDARGVVRPAVFGGPATVSVPMPKARMAAARARAEELAAAKFAGMRSAAKAKDDVHTAAGGAGAGPSAPSSGEG